MTTYFRWCQGEGKTYINSRKIFWEDNQIVAILSCKMGGAAYLEKVHRWSLLVSYPASYVALQH